MTRTTKTRKARPIAEKAQRLPMTPHPTDIEKSFGSKKYYIPIVKSNVEQQTITGVVLQPEIVDAQGDIISKEVIEVAAHQFLANYNKATKLGLMHSDFKPQFELYESYIILTDTTIDGSPVQSGSWVIVVHVLDGNVWKKVKEGKLTGFSIAGKATVVKINPEQINSIGGNLA